ncbi:MAG: glycosyltransferase family 2 protein [Lachnospiraceae bacterium]|nr:glycosyltransferase family 2 protein [Lachnospiraceae bacterium]
MKKLVIIPAYNEEKSVAGQCEEVKSSAPDYDIIVINDCSLDGTKSVCAENGIKVIDLPVNLGIGGAVQTGYRHAYENGYDIAVQIDGDGQHDPAFIKSMEDVLTKTGADLVIGSRFIENEGYQSTASRRMGIKFFSALIKLLTGEKITDPTSGLRMVGRNLIAEFAESYPQDYPEPESAVRAIRKGRKVIEVPVKMRSRTAGRSSIRAAFAVYYMIKVTIAIVLERLRRT